MSASRGDLYHCIRQQFCHSTSHMPQVYLQDWNYKIFSHIVSLFSNASAPCSATSLYIHLFYRNLRIFYLHPFRDLWGFHDGSMVKNLPTRQETQFWCLGWEDSLGRGHGNPLQYSCLKNPMNRGAWWAVVHAVTKNRTQLSMHASQGLWAGLARTNYMLIFLPFAVVTLHINLGYSNNCFSASSGLIRRRHWAQNTGSEVKAVTFKNSRILSKIL